MIWLMLIGLAAISFGVLMLIVGPISTKHPKE